MHRAVSILTRGLIWVGALLLLLVLAGWLALRASLPKVEGEATLTGLSGRVLVERDAEGVPVIRGGSRLDVARASGFVHAQERFFQMDLTRRSAAGELSALVGAKALEADRKVRIHRFRALARQVFEASAADERALLEAYAEGVNAGLAALAVRPVEYLLLRQEPQPWTPEDSLLVTYAMWITLQLNALSVELQHERLHAALPGVLYRLVARSESPWDAPLDNSILPEVPLPTADQFDLRILDPTLFKGDSLPTNPLRLTWLAADDPAAMLGSNNWALAGSRTTSGHALVANDMHLGLSLPNTWYRARLVAQQENLDVTGVTLPGTPLMVAGSNGRVAWGFTNSYGDFQDLVRLDQEPGSEERYRTPDGVEALQHITEVIEVADTESVEFPIEQTRWGPVVGRDAEGRRLVHAWTAHRPEALNLELWRMESAEDLEQAIGHAAASGMPAQNALIGDAAGRIAWVITGKLPRRAGYDPLLPSSWAEPGSGWTGWVQPAEQPRIVDPPDGRAWTANSRVVGGELYATVGNGGYAHGARGMQIRDGLGGLQEAGPRSFLPIHLDDRAVYLAGWQQVLLETLDRLGPEGAAASTYVSGWSGRAAPDDVGYRIVRSFERTVTDRSFAMLTVEARQRWPEFSWRPPARFTDVAWRLIQERPPHLLDPRFSDWNEWLDDAVRATLAELQEKCGSLDECTWGKVSSSPIRHPLSAAVPGLGLLFDMPWVELPGDWSMPRVQSQRFGASERFAVEPGREAEGYFHMPGGQAGHPLSPYYGAGHLAWVEGTPSSFLPGAVEYQLTLSPAP